MHRCPWKGWHNPWGTSLMGPAAETDWWCQSASRYHAWCLTQSQVPQLHLIAKLLKKSGSSISCPQLCSERSGPRAAVLSLLTPEAPVVKLRLCSHWALKFLSVWPGANYLTSLCFISPSVCLLPRLYGAQNMWLPFPAPSPLLPRDGLLSFNYISLDFWRDRHSFKLSNPFPGLSRVLCTYTIWSFSKNFPE